ncbi:MAG: TerB family tellurite resistance protein [Bacteroidales bacterium]|jgi:DnaJ like chaperone protein|nr:TerB family tellurite resistance protein [Bacteroidales bacterium]
MNGGCFLPLIFGIVGSFIGGPFGALLGVLVGYGISQIGVQRTHTRAKTMNNVVLEGITKLSLLLMKADASVMRSELYLFRDFMVQNFGTEIAAAAIDMLQKFKDVPLTVDEAAKDINNHLNYAEKMQVLQFLFQLAEADGQINTNELSVLSQIAQRLAIQQGDFQFLYTLHQAKRYNYNQQNYQTSTRSTTPQESDYAILGVKSSDSNETVKAAYRRLAVTHHPDKVQHLGEVARAKAEKRFSEINQAYARIKKTRNL